jgi:hypothetical protein
VLLLTALAPLAAKAAAPGFFVTVSAPTSPSGSELLLVTTDPFAYSVVTATNDQGGVITNGPGDAALDYSPDGTLYGSAGDLLSVINPATAAASNVLTLTNAAAGATTAGAALSFGRDGTLYVSDGYTLCTVNITNGHCAKIAPFHTNNSAARLTIPIYGLARAPDGTLFGGDRDLYTIDPASAAAVWIGALCAYPGFIQGRDMAFGSDGNLYMIGMDFFGGTALYSVNTNNAAISELGEFPGPAFGLVRSDNPALLAILSPPASQSVAAGGTASFSVAAAGNPAPAPQWYFDGNRLAGATNIILTILDVAATNAGSYFVVLTNVSGAVTSDVVTLTVTSNFTFLATVDPVGGGSGSIVSLSTNPPAESLLGSNSTALTCLGFDTNGVLYGANNALYRVATNSNPWGLVTVGPIIRADDSNQITLSGMAFSPSNVLYGVAGDQLFTVDTTNAQAQAVGPVYSAVNVYISAIAFGPKGTLYGGEFVLYTIDARYGYITSTIGAVSGGEILGDMKFGSDGYIYFCGGDNGNFYRLNPMTARVSLVAGFTPNLSGLAFYPAPFDTTRPSIKSQPANQVGELGGRVTISAGAAGAGPMTYIWSNGPVRVQDGSRISGAATPSLTIGNLMQSDAGTYQMTVSNGFGSATTLPATLTVGAGPTIAVQPAAATRVVEGDSVTLGVTATGAATLVYQWMAGGSIIPEANSRTLTLSAAPLNGVTTPFYTVLVRNSFGVAFSAPAEVIVLPNLTKPSVTIAVPAVGARTASNAISGTASANAIQVFYWTTNVNNGFVTVSPTNSAALAPSGSGVVWSAAPALLPGTNILVVQAQNQYSNFSVPVLRPFFYKVAAPLTLMVAADTGAGMLAGKASVAGDTVPAAGAMLNIGEGYSMTAKPNAHCFFSNWSGTAGQKATPTIQFVMESNTSLEADFITNQFIGMAGTYNGLFSAATGVAEESAGMISGLTVASNRFYSGRLVLQGTNLLLSGSFDLSGRSSNSLPRAGGAVTVLMSNLFDSQPNRIAGTVSTRSWVSDLLLVADASGPLPSAAYTMLLPPPAGAPSNSPAGYGYAVITNHAGLLSIIGQMADGAAFNRSLPVSQSGEEPFYISLYGNTGLLTGWLDFGGSGVGGQIPTGQLTWIRKASAGAKYYPAGFTNNAVSVEGSTWAAPSAGKPALPFTTNLPGLLQISGGNLAAPLDFSVAVGANNALIKLPSATASTNSLAGSINRKTGLLTVTFGNGRGKATTTGTGAVLQNSTNADGAFLGTNDAGAITLRPAGP